MNPLDYLLPALGVLAWAAIPLTWIALRHRKSASDAGSPALETVLGRLDAIDSRLAAVEKTLNEIP